MINVLSVYCDGYNLSHIGIWRHAIKKKYIHFSVSIKIRISTTHHRRVVAYSLRNAAPKRAPDVCGEVDVYYII